MNDTFDLIGHRHIMLRDPTLQIIKMMKGGWVFVGSLHQRDLMTNGCWSETNELCL